MFNAFTAPHESGNAPATTDRSRRRFLQGLGMLAAAGIAGVDPLKAQAPAGRLFRIDVHHHMISPEYLKQTSRFGSASARAASPLTSWTPAKSLEAMDRYGISTALLSIPVGGIRFENNDATRTLVRSTNEFGARIVRDHPGRFGLLASLPLPNVDASLKEIEYGYDTLKADGIAIVSSYGDKWPGDPAFAPVLEELNRRKAVIFVHPTAPNCCAELVPKVAESWSEYDFDTTRMFESLLVNGALTKFPDVRFIFSHSGGTLPVLATRIDRISRRSVPSEYEPQGALAELKKHYFDVASATFDAALAALTSVVPVQQILFGSDFPFVPVSETADELKPGRFNESELEAINRGNALRLFPVLRARER